MKEMLIVASCLFLSFIIPVKAQHSKDLVDIQNKVRKINESLPSLTKKEIINNDIDQKIIYSDDKHLVLIKIKTTLDGIEKKVEWYYDNGEFFYAEEHATNQNGLLIGNDKFYYKNKNLILWNTIENRPVESNSRMFIETSKGLYDYAMEIMEGNK